MREKGERLRDRMGSVGFPGGFDAVSDVGSVDRRGIGGLVIFVSVSRSS